MTPQPGQIGNIVPKSSDPGAMMRMFRELQQSVQALQGAQSLAAATIDHGGLTIADGGALTVTDASGNPRIILGLLADSDYGLEILDATGVVLPLASLAFGTTAVETVAAFTAAGGGAWHTDPLESTITVNVSTGRLLVTVSAVQFSSLSASNVIMSWSLSGPTSVSPDNQRGLVTATASFPAAGYGSGSYSYLHTGLTPGSYTVQSQYRCDRYGAPADSGIFENRALIVQPY